MARETIVTFKQPYHYLVPRKAGDTVRTTAGPKQLAKWTSLGVAQPATPAEIQALERAEAGVKPAATADAAKPATKEK